MLLFDGIDKGPVHVGEPVFTFRQTDPGRRVASRRSGGSRDRIGITMIIAQIDAGDPHHFIFNFCRCPASGLNRSARRSGYCLPSEN